MTYNVSTYIDFFPDLINIEPHCAIIEFIVPFHFLKPIFVDVYTIICFTLSDTPTACISIQLN